MATDLGSGREPGKGSASRRLRGRPRPFPGRVEGPSRAAEAWTLPLGSRGSVSAEGRNLFACGWGSEAYIPQLCYCLLE